MTFGAFTHEVKPFLTSPSYSQSLKLLVNTILFKHDFILQELEFSDLDKIISVRGKKLKFPFGSTQSKSIENVICSINWLLKKRGLDMLPLEKYLESMEKHFEGPFMPEFICSNNQQYEKYDCDK